MTRFINRTVLALVVAAGLFAVPTARADHFDIRIGGRPEMRRVWVEPVFENRVSQVWVEPVYRTVCEPIAVRAYYKTVCDRVFVQPVFEFREFVRFDHCGRRIVTRERVCVREGGWQTVERQELVPAHYRNEERQVLVCAGHFETRTDRVCVRDGHWEMAPVDRCGGVGVSLGLGF